MIIGEQYIVCIKLQDRQQNFLKLVDQVRPSI